jgi:uncharacterized protein
VQQNVLIAELNSPLKNNVKFVLNANAKRNKVIWRFSDNRAGHDSQSIGFVSALQERVDCEIYNIHVPFPLSSYASAVLKKLPLVSHLPNPDLLVGAGHASHFPMLLSRLLRGGRTLVIMTPTLPTQLFDFCLIPEHDEKERSRNIIPTIGPLNTIRASTQLSETEGLIVLGGESKHFYWNEDKLFQQITKILRNDKRNWIITDSPRTPSSTEHLLTSLNEENVKYVSYKQKNNSDLSSLLQKAGNVWVTEDSMSMIYEALSTGASVGLLRVDEKPKSRLGKVAQTLVEKNLLTLFNEWQSSKQLLPPARTLSESTRCANILVERLGWEKKATV